MPKIVSPSPRPRVVSVQGEAWAEEAPSAPKRASTARIRERRRIARILMIRAVGRREGIRAWASTCKIPGSRRGAENPLVSSFSRRLHASVLVVLIVGLFVVPAANADSGGVGAPE